MPGLIRGDIDRAVEQATYADFIRFTEGDSMRVPAEPRPVYCAACHDCEVSESHNVCDNCRASTCEDWMNEADFIQCQILIASDDAISVRERGRAR